MAKHRFILKELVDTAKQIGNSLNWTYTYDGRSIRFYHNGNLRLEKAAEMGVVYVFNAQRGAESLDKIAAPKDPRMKLFWEYGFFKGHFKEFIHSAYYELECHYADMDDPFYDLHIEDAYKETFSNPTWAEYKTWNADLYYRDLFDSKGNLLIAAIDGRAGDSVHTKFWFDKNKVTLEQVQEFLKDYPFRKWIDQLQ